MDVEFEEVTFKVRENLWSIRGKTFLNESVPIVLLALLIILLNLYFLD